jgi:hypothetical protein
MMFFAKIPRGGQGFQEKLPGGGVPPISGFIAFLLTSVLKFARWGYYIYPPPLPHLTRPPVCIYDLVQLCNHFISFSNFSS